MKKILFFGSLILLLNCYRETALPLSPVVATQVTSDNLDVTPNGVEATGVIGDYTIYNNYVQMVIQGNTWDPNFCLYEPQTGGAIVDLTTRTTGVTREQISKNDDGLYLLRQGVNLDSKAIISYHSMEVKQSTQEVATMVLHGRVFDLDHHLQDQGASVSASDRSVNGVEVTTEISLLAARDTELTTSAPVRFFQMTTVLSNTSSTPVPIYTVHDSVLFPESVYDAFVPFPRWGFYKPEADSNPTASNAAFPPYVLFRARQESTSNIFLTPQLDGLFCASRESEPDAERVMVGKVFSNQEPLPSGGQITFIRELHAYVGDLSSESVYEAAVSFLQESMPDSSMYQKTGKLGYIGEYKNAPAVEYTLENVSSDLMWFDGETYLASSTEYPFPVWGSRQKALGVSTIVPIGTYQIRLKALQGDEDVFTGIDEVVVTENGEEETHTIAPQVLQDQSVSMGTLITGSGHATLLFNGQDADSVKHLFRYTVQSVGDTPVPILGTIPAYNAGNILFAEKYNPTMALITGDYNIYVSHGPLYLVNSIEETIGTSIYTDEFGVESERFAASEPSVDVSIGQSISLPGYFSADFGTASALHENGLDNPADMMAFAECEDLDVIFLMDTNRITDSVSFLIGESTVVGNLQDATDTVEKLDLVDYVVAGLGYSSRGVATEELPYGKGQFAVLGMNQKEIVDNPPQLYDDPATFYDEVRTQFPDSLIMLQHPRKDLNSNRALFSSISAMLGLDSSQPLPADNSYYSRQSVKGSSTKWLDFDLLQILEGNDYSAYLKTRSDWFELLNAGIYKPITGGSMVGNTQNLSIGAVRTFVKVDNEVHRDNDLVSFWTNVRAGNMFVTNGPIVQADIAGSSFGETITNAQPTLNLKVDAAPWIPVESVRIFVDGSLFQTIQPTGFETTRLDTEVPLDLNSGSHWVVIEAGTELESFVPGTETGTFSKVYQGHTPIAISNPIFINVN